MICSAREVQLGVNVQLGETVRNGLFRHFNVLCTQSPLHECYISSCLTIYSSGHHMKKTCGVTMFLINVQSGECQKYINKVSNKKLIN